MDTQTCFTDLASTGFWLRLLRLDDVQERDQSGPEITVQIKDAEGLQAGKTAVRVRNVDVGQVTQITLSDNFEAAELHIEMNAGTADMLVEDSQFWVVKPRIGRRGISGLNTLLSGAYVQLEPGESSQSRNQFTALEQPPVTDADTDGKRIVIESDSAANIVVEIAFNIVVLPSVLLNKLTSRSRREQRPTMCSLSPLTMSC